MGVEKVVQLIHVHVFEKKKKYNQAQIKFIMYFRVSLLHKSSFNNNKTVNVTRSVSIPDDNHAKINTVDFIRVHVWTSSRLSPGASHHGHLHVLYN